MLSLLMSLIFGATIEEVNSFRFKVDMLDPKLKENYRHEIVLRLRNNAQLPLELNTLVDRVHDLYMTVYGIQIVTNTKDYEGCVGYFEIVEQPIVPLEENEADYADMACKLVSVNFDLPNIIKMVYNPTYWTHTLMALYTDLFLAVGMDENDSNWEYMTGLIDYFEKVIFAKLKTLYGPIIDKTDKKSTKVASYVQWAYIFQVEALKSHQKTMTKTMTKKKSRKNTKSLANSQNEEDWLKEVIKEIKEKKSDSQIRFEEFHAHPSLKKLFKSIPYPKFVTTVYYNLEILVGYMGTGIGVQSTGILTNAIAKSFEGLLTVIKREIKDISQNPFVFAVDMTVLLGQLIEGLLTFFPTEQQDTLRKQPFNEIMIALVIQLHAWSITLPTQKQIDE